MRPFRLIYSPSIAGYIRHLAPTVKGPLRSAIESLAEEPKRGKSLTGEFAGLLSLRYKHYRVIYRCREEHKTIEVMFAGPRADVYRLLSQYLNRLSA